MQHMQLTNFSQLHTNQRLLLEELERRGVEVEVLVSELELVEAHYAGHYEFLLDRDASLMPYASAMIAANKYICKKVLSRANLSTPQGEQFYANQRSDALNYAAKLRGPKVLKPSSASHGQGCYMDLESVDAVAQALDAFVAEFGSAHAFLIEEQKPGEEFRIFITRQGHYAVLRRDPAHVIGDACHSIGQLVELESYRRTHPRTNALCPIRIDSQALAYLKRQERHFDDVPRLGEKVYLQRCSNLALGGVCEDFTEELHPSIIKIAHKALEAMHNLPYAGIDIISNAPTQTASPENYTILELNSNPGLHMHMRPARGKARNVAALIADLIFPETRRPTS